MSHSRVVILLCIVLAVLVFLAFHRALMNDFVDWDDPIYVTQNPMVRAGLRGQGVLWAWTTNHASNWHPLTWLSLQLDASLFGRGPFGFHLTNILLHSVNTVLLFVTLRYLTGATSLSAFASALWALHPLRVESVAWVAERKDVLSCLFWILGMLAYGRYVRKPGVMRYLLVCLALACSLMSKPMAVTFPLVLLLLDYWPLHRPKALAGSHSAGRSRKSNSTGRPELSWKEWLLLVLEKVPLLALSFASCVVTLLVQQRAISSTEILPLDLRLVGAVRSYLAYLVWNLCPVSLAALYPYFEPPLWEWLIAAVVLFSVSGLAWWVRREQPYLLVGWLWFLVTLVPVIGIVQVGTQSFADRYTYICSIGLSIIVVWGLGKPAMRLGFPKIMGITAAGFIVFFSLLTWKQTQHWGSSELLWRHTLEVTGPSNTQAWTHLAGSLFLQGREDEARRCFEAALKTGSNDVAFHTSYGLFLLREGKLEQAISHLEEAVRQEPQRASIQTNLAAGLFRRDRIEEACACSRRALQIDPHYAPAYYILGLAEVQLGKDIDEALACLRQAVRLDPVNRDYRCALGCNLQRVGLLKEAASEFQEAFQLDPNWPRTFNRNAAMLIEGPDPGKRNTSWAIYLAETVCFATGGREASYLKTLAAALAEDDRYEQALATARQALARAVASGSKPLVESLKARIAEYEQKAGRPDRRQQRQ